VKVARWVLRRAALGNKCRLSDISVLETEPLVPNFVQQLPRVDTAVTVHDMDVMAEPPGKDLLRVTVVSAHTPLEAMDKNMIDRHC
ncbi:hypothetical protein ACVBJC_15090, partial [Shewanella sp. 0m-6]